MLCMHVYAKQTMCARAFHFDLPLKKTFLTRTGLLVFVGAAECIVIVAFLGVEAVVPTIQLQQGGI